jgi:tRNA (guanine-N7-)-methyltransferase
LELEGPDSTAELLEFIAGSPRLEVEIGSGNGHFLVNYALARRDVRLIGSELKKKRCTKILKKITNAGLSSVVVYHGNAEQLMQLLPPGTVDVFHIYFPDPWPKTKHRKRRFFKQPMLEKLFSCLKPGGVIYFATDVFDYFLQAKVLCSLHPGLNLRNYRLPDQVWSSMYSRKTRFAGRQVNSLAAGKS